MAVPELKEEGTFRQAYGMPDPPVSARPTVYYGWIILPVVVVMHLAGGPGQTIGISVFNPSIRSDLGLSHSALAGAYMLATLLAGTTALLAGALIDRHGIRKTMVWAVVLMGLACFFMARVNGLVMLFLALLFLRILGAGAIPLMAENTVAMWFDGRLGLATGLKNLAHAGAVATIPAGFLWLHDALGWRPAFMAIGILIWATMLPLLLFVYRNRPEDVRQEMVETPAAAGEARGDLAFGQALRTRAYWILIGHRALHGLVWAGIVFHIVPLLASRGLAAAETTKMFAAYAIILAVVQPVCGILADRLPLRFLLSAAAALMAGAVWILVRAFSAEGVLLFGAALGFAHGIEITGQATILPRYYGRAHLGKIRGGTAVAVVAGSSLGPFILGVTYDATGRFDAGLWLLAGSYALLACALPFATPPRRLG